MKRLSLIIYILIISILLSSCNNSIEKESRNETTDDNTNLLEKNISYYADNEEKKSYRWYNEDIIYNLPADLPKDKLKSDKEFMKYLKKKYPEEWEDKYNFHIYSNYYKPETKEYKSYNTSEYSSDNEKEKQQKEQDRQRQIDAGVVDFNMFYDYSIFY